MRRQLVKLETVVLQQCEEDERCQEREPDQCVGGKEDNLTTLQVGEWNGFAPYPPVILCRLPSKQLPYPHDVMI
jgi:hypothetical protein